MKKTINYRVMTRIMAVLTILTVVFIFYNSLETTERSIGRSSVIVEKVQPILDSSQSISKENFETLIRKTAHIIEFSLLGSFAVGLTLCYAKQQGKNFCDLLTAPLFLVLMVAVIDELLQSFTGRNSNVKDVLIDFFGGTMGIALAVFARKMTSIIWEK